MNDRRKNFKRGRGTKGGGRTGEQAFIDIDVVLVLDGRRVVVEVIVCHAHWSLFIRQVTVRLVASKLEIAMAATSGAVELAEQKLMVARTLLKY